MGEWIVVITITLLACISPGPDFAMVSRNGLLRSRRAGVLTAVGIGVGVLVHVCYTLLGLGWGTAKDTLAVQYVEAGWSCLSRLPGH